MKRAAGRQHMNASEKVRSKCSGAWLHLDRKLLKEGHEVRRTLAARVEPSEEMKVRLERLAFARRGCLEWYIRLEIDQRRSP